MEVVPAAKLWELSATERVSVDPVPLVMALPYWSSTVTPTVTEPPAVMGLAGWLLMASLFSAAGVTVTVVEPVLLVWLVSLTVIVWLGVVNRVTPLVNVWLPASVGWKR